MDMMFQGCSTSRFQAWQQWSTMLSWQRKLRSRAGYPASIARCFPPAWAPPQSSGTSAAANISRTMAASASSMRTPAGSRGRVARISGTDACTPPRLELCDADGLRAPKFQHAVQSMDDNVHLDHSTLVRARAQPVTDHLFEPADSGFDAGSDVVARRLLPGRASVLGDALQMAVPLRWRGRGRLAGHGRGTRWHDDRRFRMTCGDRGGNAFLVIGAVPR